jgi:hypothetical protein
VPPAGFEPVGQPSAAVIDISGAVARSRRYGLTSAATHFAELINGYVAEVNRIAAKCSQWTTSAKSSRDGIC